MQRFSSGYTQYFNWRHKLVGHLFQGRYKAILCDEDSYLIRAQSVSAFEPDASENGEGPGRIRSEQLPILHNRW